MKSTQPAIDAAPALREDHHDAVFVHQAAAGLAHRTRIASVQIDGERAQQADRVAQQRHVEQPPPRHVIDAAPDRDGDQHRVGEGLVVWRDDERASGRDVLGAAQVEVEVQTGRAADERTERVEHGRAHGPSLQKNGAGIAPGPVMQSREGCLVVVGAGLDLDGLELELAATPLQAVLATHAGLNFR